MTAPGKKYWIAFSCFSPIGPKRFNILRKYFGSAEKAWNAKREELLKSGIDQHIVDKFIIFREGFDISSYNLRLEKYNVNSITLEDNIYPDNLKSIDGAPYLLYMLGSISSKDNLSLSVVGTRNITTYGKEVTEKLVQELVLNKITIVSGLAYGVDLVAHKTSIENNGRTIGVWSGGLDTVREGYKKQLVETILNKKSGAVISEYPLGFRPMKTTFPQRNRIISGISLGVLVTEAMEDSGSLITANWAKKQGRKIFAVPGPITSVMTAGTTRLLKDGATLVYRSEDILKELNAKMKEGLAENIIFKNDNEKNIYDILLKESLEIDKLSKIIKTNISNISTILSLMEIKGLIKKTGDGKYTIV